MERCHYKAGCNVAELRKDEARVMAEDDVSEDSLWPVEYMAAEAAAQVEAPMEVVGGAQVHGSEGRRADSRKPQRAYSTSSK